MRKYTSHLIFLAILIVFLFVLTGCGDKTLADNLDKEVNESAEYLLETVPNPVVDSVGGEWAVKCIADSGIDVDEKYFERYFNNLCTVVKANKGVLSEDKLTEFARVTIALNSIGKTPTDVEGYNLVKPLDNYKVVTRQGVNAAAFALVASNISGVRLENEDKFISYIIDTLNSGELGLSADDYAVDYIAMAIEGLSFYMDREDVQASVNQAVESLIAAQQEDGSFGNCESTAETICALSQLGIDVLSDKRFNVNGKNPGDGLMRYKMEDGGFCHELEDEFSNAMASEKGLMALNAMRLCRDGKKLYASAF